MAQVNTEKVEGYITAFSNVLLSEDYVAKMINCGKCGEFIMNFFRYCMGCGQYNDASAIMPPLSTEGLGDARCPDSHFSQRLGRSTGDKIEFCPDCGGKLDDLDK